MRKVLIIDDEQSIRDTLKEILEYEKYEVSEAKNGEEGLKLLTKENLTWLYATSKCQKWTGWSC